MLAGISEASSAIKKYGAKVIADEQTAAADVSFDGSIKKDYLDALDAYLSQSSNRVLAEPSMEIIGAFKLRFHFDFKKIKQQITDKLYPDTHEIPQDSLINAVLERVSTEFSEETASTGLPESELLHELSKKAQAKSIQYILHYLILYHLALKITNLANADTAHAIIDRLFTAESFKESGLAAFIQNENGPQVKLALKIAAAHERVLERQAEIRSQLVPKVKEAENAFSSALEFSLNGIVHEIKENVALEKLPEGLRTSFLNFREICKQQAKTQKEIRKLQNDLDKLNTIFNATIGSVSPKKAEIRSIANPLNSPERKAVKTKRVFLESLEAQRKQAAIELKAAIESLGPEKPPALEQLLMPPSKYDLEGCVSIIESATVDTKDLQEVYAEALEKVQALLPEAVIEAQFLASGILTGIVIMSKFEAHRANGGAGVIRGGAGAAASPQYVTPTKSLRRAEVELMGEPEAGSP